MPLSKKNYVAIADIVNRMLWNDGSDPLTVVAFSAELSDYFASDNDRFDRERFMQACLRNPDSRDTVSQPGYDAYKQARAQLGI